MTKRTRKIIFLVFLFLFLLVAPVAVLYSQGYRLDFESKKLTQTGGLFLKIVPKQAEVYLDGKLKKKTDFFFGSILIENLLPKKYTIKVEKEGYQPWEKFLEIKEKEVTEAKNIVLFPENPDFTILTKGVENLWFSSDQRKIILKETDEKGWALKLYELDKNIKSHLIEEKDVSIKGAELFDLTFSDNSKELLLGFGIEEQIKYFTLGIDKIPPVLKESELPTPLIKNAVVYEEINEDIYYLDNFGDLFRNDLKMTEEPFPVKQETEYKLEIFQNHAFLQEGKTLYQLNPETKSFEKISEGIKSFEISPNSNKLVYFSDYEIWILYLEDEMISPQRKKGEKVFLIRLSEKIKDCSWLNSDYLIFDTGETFKIAEIDARDKVNIANIGELKNPRIFWNEFDKRLYVLSENNLYRSRTLLP